MYHFFAIINRMKHINRWGLMRNTDKENLKEHSFQTAVIAHALALIQKNMGDDIDPNKTAVMALYHDASEIITGDMPTPVKYYNKGISSVYKAIEKDANNYLLSKLSDGLRKDYIPLFNEEDSPEHRCVKAADTLSAYIKCLEESKAGNREFDGAAETILKKLNENPLPALKVFMRDYLESYTLTLDAQS